MYIVILQPEGLALPPPQIFIYLLIWALGGGGVERTGVQEGAEGKAERESQAVSMSPMQGSIQGSWCKLKPSVRNSTDWTT